MPSRRHAFWPVLEEPVATPPADRSKSPGLKSSSWPSPRLGAAADAGQRRRSPPARPGRLAQIIESRDTRSQRLCQFRRIQNEVLAGLLGFWALGRVHGCVRRAGWVVHTRTGVWHTLIPYMRTVIGGPVRVVRQCADEKKPPMKAVFFLPGRLAVRPGGCTRKHLCPGRIIFGSNEYN